MKKLLPYIKMILFVYLWIPAAYFVQDGESLVLVRLIAFITIVFGIWFVLFKLKMK